MFTPELQFNGPQQAILRRLGAAAEAVNKLTGEHTAQLARRAEEAEQEVARLHALLQEAGKNTAAPSAKTEAVDDREDGHARSKRWARKKKR